ncbi:hypothetical protein RO575_00025 [Methylomonas sp. MO1]|uniref:hypothetical protein n=1 Tax=unclassified Methylomonas TaxID=2608980 RepID=UPI00047B403A|nr:MULTISPECIES: hypothetical protein [unclassified Methylomonas]MDT4287938.1 hypothetical protein [Methylomonas sp. MO1]
MSAHELRAQARRSVQTRRLRDRRQTDYPFGSPEWLENIKNAYVAWPKADRRDHMRRAEDRRMADRRHTQASEQQRAAQKYSRVVLTSEERRLIQSLYLPDTHQ